MVPQCPERVNSLSRDKQFIFYLAAGSGPLLANDYKPLREDERERCYINIINIIIMIVI